MRQDRVFRWVSFDEQYQWMFGMDGGRLHWWPPGKCNLAFPLVFYVSVIRLYPTGFKARAKRIGPR